VEAIVYTKRLPSLEKKRHKKNKGGVSKAKKGMATIKKNCSD